MCDLLKDLNLHNIVMQRIRAIDTIVALSRRQEVQCPKSQLNKSSSASSVEGSPMPKEESPVPNIFPLKCKKTQCIFYIGNDRQSYNRQMRKFSKPDKMMDHVERHLEKRTAGKLRWIFGSQQQNEHSVIDYLAVNKLFSNTQIPQFTTFNASARPVLQEVTYKDGVSSTATGLRLQGKHAEAEAMHLQTLKLRETMLGKDHPDTLASMNNLAIALDKQGKRAEAEAMHLQTLKLRETMLGKDHPDTLASMNNLAIALDK
ncbi:hypothetical protein V500_02302, partial [Pseudogymnoascus sp. VKM F-4518 (FW-2643)]